jgi:hypothetical protein
VPHKGVCCKLPALTRLFIPRCFVILFHCHKHSKRLITLKEDGAEKDATRRLSALRENMHGVCDSHIQFERHSTRYVCILLVKLTDFMHRVL